MASQRLTGTARANHDAGATAEEAGRLRAIPAALVLLALVGWAPGSLADDLAPASLSLESTEASVLPAAAPAPSRVRRPSTRSLSLDRGTSIALAFDANAPQTSVPADGATDAVVVARPGRFARSASAFAMELREESLRFVETSPWSRPPEAILQDDVVRDGRERAARNTLRKALEAGVDMTLRDAFDRHAEARVVGRGRYSGLRLDMSPSWTVRRSVNGVSVRLDVPLTTEALRFHCSKDLANDNGLRRVAGAISVDPFDESVRFALSLGF